MTEARWVAPWYIPPPPGLVTVFMSPPSVGHSPPSRSLGLAEDARRDREPELCSLVSARLLLLAPATLLLLTMLALEGVSVLEARTEATLTPE